MAGIGKNRRTNPQGLSQSSNQAHTTMLSQHVERTATTGITMESPITDSKAIGFNVKDWGSIHVVFYPSYTGQGAKRYWVTVRAWRYFEVLPRADAEDTVNGQWVHDLDVEVPLNSSSALNTPGSQHHVWDTRDAAKMYLQIVSTRVDPEGEAFDVDSVFIQPFGYTRKDGIYVTPSTPSTISSSPASSGSTTVNVDKLLVGDRTLYSTANSHWSIVWASATTLKISDGGGNYPDILASQILSILEKTTGTTGSSIEYKGTDLACSYVPASGVITVSGAAFAATSEFDMQWEEHPRAINMHGEVPYADAAAMEYINQEGLIARSTLPAAVTNGDAVAALGDLYGRTMLSSHQLLTQSDRVEEINPLNEKEIIEELVDDETITASTTLYYPSEAGGTLENYAQLSFGYHLNGGVLAGAPVTETMTIETNYDGDGAAGRWTDITKAGYLPKDDTTVGASGASSIISTGNTPNAASVDFNEIRGGWYRVKITWSAAPEVGNPGAAVIHAQRMVM